MTRPAAYCPACKALTITYRRRIPGSSGDVETTHDCTRCTWNSDTITTAICPHTTTDHCPKCGANEKETNDDES